MELNDYEVLIVVTSLAHYTRFGFAMKPMAWSKFLRGGGDENITINHVCGGGDCGGSGNSDCNSDGNGGGGNGGGSGGGGCDGGDGGGGSGGDGDVGSDRGNDSDERRRR